MRAEIIAFVTSSVLACATPAQAPTAARSVAAVVADDAPTLAAYRSLLRTYDQAGFPSGGDAPLLQRTIGWDGGSICRRGIVLDDETFFDVGLETDHGSAPFDAIPDALRHSTPPPQSFYPHPQTIAAPELYDWRVTSIELPDSALLLPYLGVPREGNHDTCRSRAWTSPELDLLIRARWAEARGATEIRDAILGELRRHGSPTALELALRNELADHLERAAIRGLYEWMPRSEVAALLERATELAPRSPRAAMWREQVPLLRAAEPTRAVGDLDALVRLVPDQAMFPGSLPPVPPQALRTVRWNVVMRLRDPLRELYSAGMPGAARLVALLGDRRWTRFAGRSGPARVGELAREALAAFAARPFASDDEVRAWWEAVNGMTEAQMLRATLRGPALASAALRLADLHGPRAIDDFVALVGVHSADAVMEAVTSALWMHMAAIIDDAGLRRRYARAYDRLIEAGAAGAELPRALHAWSVVDPDAAFDQLAVWYATKLREGDHELLFDDELSQVLVQRVVERRHRAMLAVLRQAIAFGPTHHSAIWAHIRECVEEPTFRCRRSLHEPAIQALRRSIVAQAPTRWTDDDDRDVVLLAALVHADLAELSTEDPIVARIDRGTALAGHRRPKRALDRGATQRVVATFWHASASEASDDAKRWLDEQRGRVVADLAELLDAHRKLAASHPTVDWSLLIVRRAGAGIELHLDDVPMADGHPDELIYRDGHAIAFGSLDRGSLREAVNQMLRDAGTSWNRPHPPAVTEIAVRIRGTGERSRR